MLIDHFLPRFNAAHRHSMTIEAPRELVFSTIQSVDLSRSAVIRLLFRLRGLPVSNLTLEGLQELGFRILALRLDQEIVLGIAGQFWTIHGNLQAVDGDNFKRFAQKGYAKAVWSFYLEDRGEHGTELTTETRIQCLDQESLRRFRLYWMAIRPFSGWVRRKSLWIIKCSAEGSASNSKTKTLTSPK